MKFSRKISTTQLNGASPKSNRHTARRTSNRTPQGRILGEMSSDSLEVLGLDHHRIMRSVASVASNPREEPQSNIIGWHKVKSHLFLSVRDLREKERRQV